MPGFPAADMEAVYAVSDEAERLMQKSELCM